MLPWKKKPQILQLWKAPCKKVALPYYSQAPKPVEQVAWCFKAGWSNICKDKQKSREHIGRMVSAWTQGSPSLTVPVSTSRTTPTWGPQQGTELKSFTIPVTQGSTGPPFSAGRDTEAQDSHARTSRVCSKTLRHISYQENQTFVTKTSYETFACC